MLYTLYTSFRSSSSYRVRIALNIKEIPYEPVFVSLVEGEQSRASYLSKNPQGLVPTLEVDGVALTQSAAIIEYLEQNHPTPPLLPDDAVARARVRALVNLVACDIQPLNNLQVLKYLKKDLGLGQDQIDAWYDHWILRGFTALEHLVEIYGSERHCFGDSLTMADVYLVPQLWNARRFKTSLVGLPNLVRIDAALNEMDAFRNAAPENQQDAL